MHKKNVILFFLICIIFITLLSHMRYTGLVVYRVPFNIEVDIQNNEKEVDAGDIINANLIFYNLLEPTSISFNYSIKSLKGNVLFVQNENIYVQNETILKRGILIPKTAPAGYYLLVVEWGSSFARSSSLFKVNSEIEMIKFSAIKILMSLVLISIALLIILMIITHNNVLNSLTNLNKARISLFFWKIGWILRQHNYYIKYIIIFIILCLLAIILILINY